MKKINFLILIALLVFYKPTKAQDNERKINFKGFSQLYLSAMDNGDDTPAGFSIRRLRFKPYGKFNDNFKWAFQLGFGKNKFSVLDVYLRYELNDMVNFQIGKFAAVGSRSGDFGDALFSTTKMTCIQRPSIIQKWGNFSDLHGYRNIGFQVDGKLNKKFFYAVKLASYSGKDLFTPTVKPEDDVPFDKSIAIGTRLEYFISDEFSIGGFFRKGEKKTQIEEGVVEEKQNHSFGGHILYRSKTLRFMAEYIKGETITDLEKVDADDVKTEEKFDGFFVEGGYAFGKIMPAVRFCYYNAPEGGDLENQSNITLGVNYFPIKNVKLQANYIIRSEEMKESIDQPDNNLFMICFQYTFSSKQ